MMDNVNKEKLSNAHKQTLTERRVLNFELSELTKVSIGSWMFVANLDAYADLQETYQRD